MEKKIIQKNFSCLKYNSIYKKNFLKVLKLFKSIEKKKEYDHLRCNVSYKLFFNYEKVIKNNIKAEKKYAQLLEKIFNEVKDEIELIKFKINQDKKFISKLKIKNKQNSKKLSIEKLTGDHYSKIFLRFNKYHLVEQPYELLKKRFLRNKFDLNYFKGKKGLDIGCGNGRYTLALKKMGLKSIIGCDISPVNIKTCNENKKKLGIKNIKFQKQDALKLKYPTNSFDFTMSYGVFHHTKSLNKSVKEMVRVTKKGGIGLIFFIGGGGIRWSIIELCRKILQQTDNNFIYNYFYFFPFAEKYYYLFLDHLLTPINNLKSPDQLNKMFNSLEIKKYKKWDRGSDFDEVERVYKSKTSKIKKYNLFGHGECRYLFIK